MSKTFVESFLDARRVSTPLVAIRTFDAASTISNIRKAVNDNTVPYISWDSIHGLKGLGDPDNEGSKVLNTLATLAGVELPTSLELPVALGLLEFAGEQNIIVFLHNPHLVWNNDPKVIQGMWNLRDLFTANGNMLMPLIGAGDELPIELQQDTLVLDEPLPTRAELAKIVDDSYDFALEEKRTWDISKKTPEIVKAACDALIGIPAFPAGQSTAMCLNPDTGILDLSELWTRKKTIVSQRKGLSYHTGSETLADMYGCAAFRKFAVRMMEGKHAPTLILRMDEVQRQFSGNETDSSGSTGKLLGEFLTWVEDNKVICTLQLGVPGSSKSWSTYCIGGEYKKPVVNYNVAQMEDKHVGEGNRHMLAANRTLDAISDGKIWLLATANNLRGLPPEFISRFQVGGIFFFDAPDAEEREGIMKLKVKKYNLEDQPFPDMEGWTGRDVENCARKADLLSVSLIEAGKLVVPLMKSHHEEMDALRHSAHDRFLSASHEGVYQYTAPSAKTVVHAPVINGRKIR